MLFFLFIFSKRLWFGLEIAFETLIIGVELTAGVTLAVPLGVVKWPSLTGRFGLCYPKR